MLTLNAMQKSQFHYLKIINILDLNPESEVSMATLTQDVKQLVQEKAKAIRVVLFSL